jgi:hypothetical protein
LSAREYWFVVNGERQGPLPLEQLWDRYRENVIGPDTLVWGEGMPQWLPLSETELRDTMRPMPPPLPAQVLRPGSGVDQVFGSEDAALPAATYSMASEGTAPVAPVPAPAASPGESVARRAANFGQRAAARMAEVVIWFFPAALVIGLMTEQLGLDIHVQVSAWFLFVFVLLAEAACLAIFGNSAGKALVGIRVERLDAASWDFASASRRALGLWAYGMGFGALMLFPMLENPNLRPVLAVLALAPFVWQSGRVAYGSPANYDSGRFAVYRRNTHWWRTLAVFVVAAAMFAGIMGVGL